MDGTEGLGREEVGGTLTGSEGAEGVEGVGSCGSVIVGALCVEGSGRLAVTEETVSVSESASALEGAAASASNGASASASRRLRVCTRATGATERTTRPLLGLWWIAPTVSFVKLPPLAPARSLPRASDEW